MSEIKGGVEAMNTLDGSQSPHPADNPSRVPNGGEGAKQSEGISSSDCPRKKPSVEPIKYIGAQTLMEKFLEPPVWLVDGLLSTSTTCLLAAPPKTGKSFLALQLGHAVAKGLPFLGCDTVKSPVLYLALEDVEFRLQLRMWGLADESSDDFALAMSVNTLRAGLIEQLEEHLAERPDTKLFIIDTLQLVRDGDADYKYSADYGDLRMLKAFADEHAVCCVAITHLRKFESGDPFADISGTTGITGAVDQMMVMKKSDRRSSNCDLFVTGRDVLDAHFKLRRENVTWEVVEKTCGEELEAETIPDCIKSVVRFISEAGVEWTGTVSELHDAINPEDVTVPMLGKFLAQHREWMGEHGVAYAAKRTATARTVTLAPIAENEKNETSIGGDTPLANPVSS